MISDFVINKSMNKFFIYSNCNKGRNEMYFVQSCAVIFFSKIDHLCTRKYRTIERWSVRIRQLINSTANSK